MGLIWEIIKTVVTGCSDTSSEKDRIEKEMDYNNLFDYQKELVRKGDYEPHNFEESGDLDEDDYWYEEK